MTIQFKEYGNKHAPLMVFLHGGGVSGWMWDTQIGYFTHYHCLVPDLPSHGLSKKAGHFSIKSSALQIVDLIEDKALGKEVIVIGFSLGAQVLVQILSMKPTLIDYAIINSALVSPNPYVKRLLKPSIILSAPLIKGNKDKGSEINYGWNYAAYIY